jgi:dienelactone hydrolase
MVIPSPSPFKPAAAVALCACLFACATGEWPRPAATFDLPAARRSDDLALVTAPVSRQLPPHIDAVEVSYLSTEWAGGVPRPIRIRGYLARRSGGARVPAVIYAHGLGAGADLSVALDVARNLDVVALSISAPGLGGSEGRGVTFADASALFDDGQDVRRSWLYAYVHALLRAVTLLAARPDVDPAAVVVTGVSMGGIASFIVGGVDERVAGILPVSACGDLARAAAAGSWMGALVGAAQVRGAPPAGAQALLSALDPLAFAGHQHGIVYMLDGAQDEFFPLPQVLTTFARISAPARSLALVADYDHGWYFGKGCTARCTPGGPSPPDRSCPASCPPCQGGARWPYCGKQGSYDRQEEATARWGLLLRTLVDRVSGRPGLPPPPAPQVERQGDQVIVRVGTPPPRVVRLAVSDNGGYTYGQFRLAPSGAGDYRFTLPPGTPAGAIIFAEVEGEAGAVATSVPALPPGFRPPVRPFGPP